jgi:exoribonuclease R
MILANEVVARHLEGQQIPSIYRIHEEPDPAKVESFADMVSTFGLKFRPKRVRPAEFQRFISSIEGRPDERMLSYLMLALSSRQFIRRIMSVISGSLPMLTLISHRLSGVIRISLSIGF